MMKLTVSERIDNMVIRVGHILGPLPRLAIEEAMEAVEERLTTSVDPAEMATMGEINDLKWVPWDAEQEWT